MQTLTLIHPVGFPIGRYADVLTREAISAQSLDALEHLTSDGGALRVLLVDPVIVTGRPSRIDARTAVVGIGLTEQPRWLTDESIYFHLPENPSPAALLNAVKRAYQFLYQKLRADQLERQLGERTRELREVSEVGIALSTERDHSVLLTMILSKARELSRADAGSLYLLDDVNGEQGAALEAGAERFDRRRCLRGNGPADHAHAAWPATSRSPARRWSSTTPTTFPPAPSTRSTAPSTRRTAT